MASEYLDVGVKFIEPEYDQRQAPFVARCDRPVVFKDLAKCPSVEQPRNRVISRKIPNAAFRLEQGVVHLGAVSRCRTRAAAPVCGVNCAAVLSPLSCNGLRTSRYSRLSDSTGKVVSSPERTDSLTSSASSRPAISSITSAKGLPVTSSPPMGANAGLANATGQSAWSIANDQYGLGRAGQNLFEDICA